MKDEKEARGQEYVPVGPVRIRRSEPPKASPAASSERVARVNQKTGWLYDTNSGVCLGATSEEMRAKYGYGVKFKHFIAGVEHIAEIAK